MQTCVENMLSEVRRLWSSGCATEAELMCRRVLSVEEEHPAASLFLAEMLSSTNRTAEAVRILRRQVFTKPHDAALARRLGVALLAEGSADAARTVLMQAINLEPGNARGHNNLGEALYRLDEIELAIASYKRAIECDGTSASAHSNLGRALHRWGRPDEAIFHLRRALDLDPNMVQAHCLLGDVQLCNGGLSEAGRCYSRAVQIDERSVEAWFGKANVALASGAAMDALSYAQRVLTLKADYAPARSVQSKAFQQLGDTAGARRSLEQAVAASPDDPEALLNLGLFLGSQADWDAALACFDRIATIQPDCPYLQGYRLCANQCSAIWSDYDRCLENMTRSIERGERACSPFFALLVTNSPAVQRKCAETFAADFYPARHAVLQRKARVEGARIRVGYLSADFFEHATAYLMAGLFEAHDRSRFEIYGLSIGRPVDDPMSRRLNRAFGGVIGLHGFSDGECAQRIAELGIDILIDLKGYTSCSRPGILAVRPAPVQVNYLGYPGTMGAPYIDYLIADRHVVPSDEREHYSEQIIYLPVCYQVNDRMQEVAPHRPPRSDCGLPQRGFVYCCFNNLQKLTPEVFRCWMRILKRVPDSVLWLLHSNLRAVERLKSHAVECGVAAERLIFAPSIPHAEHLARYQVADLFLDTLPYNAHTTGSDALYAGCPLLTITGSTFAGRVGTSMLHAIGATDQITVSMADYEARAVELALSPNAYAAVRIKAKAAAGSALFDTERTRRALEEAYLRAWERYTSGKPPSSFYVVENPATSM